MNGDIETFYLIQDYILGKSTDFFYFIEKILNSFENDMLIGQRKKIQKISALLDWKLMAMAWSVFYMKMSYIKGLQGGS